MSETPRTSNWNEPEQPSVPALRLRLEEIARRLEQAGALDAESQRVLAELVEELASALETDSLPAAEVAHLAEITDHLAESLRHQHDRGLLEKTRESLERAVTDAEARAPFAVGLARRLLDALANIGI